MEHVPSALHIFPVVHGMFEPHLHFPGAVFVAVQLLLVTASHIGNVLVPAHAQNFRPFSVLHIGFNVVHPGLGNTDAESVHAVKYKNSILKYNLSW